MANVRIVVHVSEMTDVGFMGLSRWRATQTLKGEITKEQLKQIKDMLKVED